MFPKDATNDILNRLDRAASMIQTNASKWGIPERVANALVQDIDKAADTVEVLSFGEKSLAARQQVVVAKVIQKDSDEPYMGTFDNPMKPILTNSDEPYMQAYADDQSSAVQSGKSTTGQPLAPLLSRGSAMAIDYWSLAKDFRPGDYVQKVDYVRGGLSPFMGKVLASHPGLGVVDVQFPTGNERLFSDDIVRVHKSLCKYLPPSLDQSYSGYDIDRARVASGTSLKVADLLFNKRLAHFWLKGATPLQAWDQLYREFPSVGDDPIRQAVNQFYGASERLFSAFIKRRTAAYWYAENRSYRVTKAEMDRGSPGCPKCGTPMRKTTYKMEEGKRVRLFACPKDLFLLKMDSLHGPDGNPISSW